jgi:hypothetical protein
MLDIYPYPLPASLPAWRQAHAAYFSSLIGAPRRSADLRPLPLKGEGGITEKWVYAGGVAPCVSPFFGLFPRFQREAG